MNHITTLTDMNNPITTAGLCIAGFYAMLYIYEGVVRRIHRRNNP